MQRTDAEFRRSSVRVPLVCCDGLPGTIMGTGGDGSRSPRNTQELRIRSGALLGCVGGVV